MKRIKKGTRLLSKEVQEGEIGGRETLRVLNSVQASTGNLCLESFLLGGLTGDLYLKGSGVFRLIYYLYLKLGKLWGHFLLLEFIRKLGPQDSFYLFLVIGIFILNSASILNKGKGNQLVCSSLVRLVLLL